MSAKSHCRGLRRTPQPAAIIRAKSPRLLIRLAVGHSRVKGAKSLQRRPRIDRCNASSTLSDLQEWEPGHGPRACGDSPGLRHGERVWLARLPDPFKVTSPPRQVTLYGYCGKHLELTVPDLPHEGEGSESGFTECVDGNLKSWIAPTAGAFYGYSGPGYTEEFWILDVEGSRLVIRPDRRAVRPLRTSPRCAPSSTSFGSSHDIATHASRGDSHSRHRRKRSSRWLRSPIVCGSRG